MTDRVRSLVVALEDDIRVDDVDRDAGGVAVNSGVPKHTDSLRLDLDDSLAARRAFRRKLLAASAAKHGALRLRRPKPPTGIILAYTSALLATSRAMDATIMSALRARGLVRQDAAEGEAPAIASDELARLVAELKRKLAAIGTRASLAGQIDRIANRAVRFSRAEWREQIKSTLGIDLTADPDTAKLVDQFRARQTKYITSLAADKVERVRTVLRDVNADTPRGEIQKRIMEETGATESRAALIARTETVTLNSELMQARHQAAGVLSFQWSTSNDERVRPSHAALNGRTFQYATPPIVDGEPLIPGQTYNCRCVALGILPDAYD